MTQPKAKICYLHIGAEKTGTTSIQSFLRSNREDLEAQGYCFPKVPGLDNQPALAAYAMEDCSRKNLLAQVGVSSMDQLVAFKERFASSLKKEVAMASPERIVLSNEHCHSRIRDKKELEQLASLLREIAGEIRIIFYIRRQDHAAVSLFSTALKVGQSRRKPNLDVYKQKPLPFDYWHTCRMYEEVFGSEAMKVRLFDKSWFKGGNLIRDFCFAVGLQAEANWTQPVSENPSLDRLAQRFLSAFNKERKKRFGPKADQYRMALVRMLEKHFAGNGIKPSKKAARDFLSQFSDDNEKIRARYFPELAAPLFGDDFSMYPDEGTDWVPPPAMAFDAGARLFVEQQKEIDRLRAKLDSLKKTQE